MYAQQHREETLEEAQRRKWRAAQARHRAGPEGRRKAAEKTRAWVAAKVSTAEGRAAFNAAQARRKRARRANPERWPVVAIASARARCRKSGLPCTISPADIPVPAACPVLGTTFVYGTGYRDPRCPSIDRIKLELGYVPGNVRVISLRANVLRNDASAEELRRVAAYATSLESFP